MYIVYIAINVINYKKYIGVTNNFKRRLKEHMNSPYPFGRALRKYGKENFSFQEVPVKDVHEAMELEALLVGEEEASSDEYYNVCIGGTLGDVLKGKNPMHDPNVVAKHPSLFTTTKNPMLNPKSKQKMIEAQKRKAVTVEGKEYPGVREAARSLGISRQLLIHRIKSVNFPLYSYLDKALG